MTITSLTINAYFVNQNEWQKKAIAEWNKCLAKQGYSKWDNYKEPEYPKKVVECMKWINYVIAQEKYYRGK